MDYVTINGRPEGKPGWGEKPTWVSQLLLKWRGFCCLVLTDDSPVCEPINNYIERYWWNLHAKSDTDLLILAVAKAPPNWGEELNRCLPKGQLRTLVRKNLRLLDKPEGMAKARSTVYAFLRNLEEHNQKQIKLPALALFYWSHTDAKTAEETECDKHRIWERYPFLKNLIVLELPALTKPADIDKMFNDVICAVGYSSDDHELRKRILRIRFILRVKATMGSLFCLFDRLAPFIK